MHFHLKTHPTQVKEWDKIFGKRDSSIPVRPVPTYIMLHLNVWQTRWTLNLLHLGRAHNAIRLHWKLAKTWEDLTNLFDPGWHSTSVPSGEKPPCAQCTRAIGYIHHMTLCTVKSTTSAHGPEWPLNINQAIPFPPRCFIKVVNFQILRIYPNQNEKA